MTEKVSENMVTSFMKNHIVQLIGLVFLAGAFYARFLILEQEVSNLKDQLDIKNESLEEKLELEINIIDDRLSKKIKLLNELDDRLDRIERCKSSH